MVTLRFQVETQRMQFKRLPRTLDPITGMELGVQPNKRLTAERLQKLEAIGFAWSAKLVRKNTNTAVSNKAATNLKSVGDVPEMSSAPTSRASTPASTSEDGIAGPSDPTMDAAQYSKVQALPQKQQQRRHRLNDAQWEGETRTNTMTSMLSSECAHFFCFSHFPRSFRHVSAFSAVQG